MGENTKMTLKNAIITIVVGVLTGLFMFKITSAREDSQILKKELDSKAPYEYVDKKDKENKDALDEHKKEQTEFKIEINNRLNRIESKVDDSNNKIIDLWKEMKANKR